MSLEPTAHVILFAIEAWGEYHVVFINTPRLVTLDRPYSSFVYPCCPAGPRKAVVYHLLYSAQLFMDVLKQSFPATSALKVST